MLGSFGPASEPPLVSEAAAVAITRAHPGYDLGSTPPSTQRILCLTALL